MTETTNIVRLRQPDAIDDPLTDILRAGARKLLAQAIEIEAEAYLASMRDLKLPDGRERLVRHGHGPERTIQTGIGPVRSAGSRSATAAPRAMRTGSASPRRSCRNGPAGRRAWMRCCRSSTCAASRPATSRRRSPPLLGKDAPNLSPSVITRLTGEWQAEYERWQARDLSARRYVYVWADGVYLQARMEDQAECMLVLIGATPEGKKELVGFQAGVRESAQSWRELLVEIKRRGLTIPPRIAVGDGALGFWKALDELFPGTHHQRCWLHKTANVLNKVPKSVQPGMKAALREIYLAPTRAQAEVAVDLFAEAYGARYPKAVECLRKDQRALLAFYDWPAEHWIHLRTTNPIESVFATVRHRTVRTKGSLSPTTARLMVFKLIMAAAKTWRRLMGENQLPKVIAGVRFQDGAEIFPTPAHNVA